MLNFYAVNLLPLILKQKLMKRLLLILIAMLTVGAVLSPCVFAGNDRNGKKVHVSSTSKRNWSNRDLTPILQNIVLNNLGFGKIKDKLKDYARDNAAECAKYNMTGDTVKQIMDPYE